MIEMLGVLAIIGVLSAGGIWGYTTAMTTYHTNKFISDMTSMAMRAQSILFPPNPRKDETNYGGAGKRIVAMDLCRLGIIDEAYCKTLQPADRNESVGCTGDYYLGKTPFGAKLLILAILNFNQDGSHRYVNNDGTTTTMYTPWSIFTIGINNVPKAACVKILTTMDMKKTGYIYAWWASSYTWPQVFSSPATMEEAEAACVPYNDRIGINLYAYMFFSGKRVDS